MEEKSLKVIGENKTFFGKITNSITKLLIPTKVGINGMLISLKRNAMLKAYENCENCSPNEDINKKEALQTKFEDAYALYLEAIDKYIMDSIYKKVKSETATEFERNAISKYYMVTHLKETEYLEYKHRKQKYLLELDFESIMQHEKNKLISKYKQFYVGKMDGIYKGILKNYSVKLADSQAGQSKDEIYKKIFELLEEYISEILPIKIEKDVSGTYKEIVSDYDAFEKFTVGKLDERDHIEKNMILLGISRKLFTHSIPLVVAEQCYDKLLQDARGLIIRDAEQKQQKAYELVLTLNKEYKIKLLSTKVYWEKQEQKEHYKELWGQYKVAGEVPDEEQREFAKEILIIREELSSFDNKEKKNEKLVKFYHMRLVKLGVMRVLKNSRKSTGKYKKKKVENKV